ncbi:MAG: hypothetical protein EBZ36_15475, partial [Acidobacteria bacterium]|nr:hypothetical protein [Acidobacteriota bacterium]
NAIIPINKALWTSSYVLFSGGLGLLVFALCYWLLLKFVAAPGSVAGDLTRAGSLPSWVDRTLLAGHIYRPEYDPEGILSTIPAIVTALIGVLAGQWLRQDRDRMEKVAGLFAAGFLLLLQRHHSHQQGALDQLLRALLGWTWPARVCPLLLARRPQGS